MEKACELCGTIYRFRPYRLKKTKFCSRRCTLLGHPEITQAAHSACRGRSSHNFSKVTIECLECRKRFDVSPSRVGINKFCSVDCYTEFRKVSKNSYRTMRVNGMKVQAHRFLMQKKLGRKLSKNEIVHHKNGDRSDNRIRNLQIMEHGQHSWFHNSAPATKVIGKAKRRR